MGNILYSFALFLSIIIFPFSRICALENDTTKSTIHVIAKVTDKTIVLRWAPDKPSAWRKSNEFGYKIRRYTYYKKKKKLTPPIEKELTLSPVRPLVLEAWEKIIQNNDYAAVAAQSLYGDSMEVEVKTKNINALIERSKSFEYNYSFALLAADQSFPVAEALGLAFTDRDIHKDEIYVYKIFSLVTDRNATIDTGTVVVRAGELSILPPVEGLIAGFGDRTVSLTWNVKYLKNYYTSYRIERSDDGGRTFHFVNKSPFANAVNDDPRMNDWSLYRDSLPQNGFTYYYRVKGYSPFGDTGPDSKVVSGRGLLDIIKPRIKSTKVIQNKKIDIAWEYPDSLNALTKGFIVKSSSSPDRAPVAINKILIGTEKREFVYLTPKSYNYISVSAIRAADDQEYATLPVMVQLLDTIPPAPPLGLKGVIDSIGTVSLNWNKNNEDDVLGYRVYFANSRDDEFSQITVSPLKDISFTWKVPLNNLSNKIYFKIVAVDTHFNTSKFSAIAEVIKPDTIPPTCPVFKRVFSSDTAIYLEFYPSSSFDVSAHRVYRRSKDSIKYTLIATLSNPSKILGWSDKSTLTEVVYEYAVTAIDASNNESHFSPTFKAQRINTGRKEELTIQAKADKTVKIINLAWKKMQYPVTRYCLYRAVGTDKPSLYRILNPGETYYIDKELTVNTIYRYKIAAEYTDGTVNYSKEIEVKY